MEFVEGDSLTELIRTSKKIEPSRAITLLKEVAHGLSAAHDKGVVHRDIKPDNIMLTRHGGVKVVDFGVARVDDPNTKLTATGMAVGTPNYISPEVCLGLEVDQRSDLFSMGIVLYEMLTGESPFNADSPLEMMTNVVQAEVPDITSLNPNIDDGLRSILYHLLEKKPDYRYQDFHQVLEDIEAYSDGRPLPHAGKATSRPTMKVDTAELTRTVAGNGVSRKPWTLAASLLLAAVFASAAGWQILGPGFEFGGGGAPTLEVLESGTDSPLPSAEEEPAQPSAGNTDNSAIIDEPDDITEMIDRDVADNQLSGNELLANTDEVGVALPDTELASGFIATTGTTGGGTVKSISPPAPDYSAPKLVVVVAGDPAVSIAIESTLEEALSDASFAVLNEQFFGDYRGDLSIAGLADVTLNNGGDIVVLAEVVSTGTRQLEYYGRRELQTTATLQVTAMLPAEKRNLGAPWQADIAYTSINAAEQGRNAAEPISRELVGRLNELSASQ
jgi:serine/threonine-protein kinase